MPHLSPGPAQCHGAGGGVGGGGTYKLLHFSGEGGEGGKQAAVANC